MSCDDISRYSVSSQSGSKGSEAVSYYLDQDSGQYFSLLEGDGPPGPDYDRGRNTGVRRRDKTPTHGKMKSAIPQYKWGSKGSGPVCVVEQHALCHHFSHLFLRAPPYMFIITHFMALLFCVFTSHTHVPKTLITCQRSVQTQCVQLPVCPTTCVNLCPRQLPRHPVPSSETLKGPMMRKVRIM